jgi:prephenate dehydrogenase
MGRAVTAGGTRLPVVAASDAAPAPAGVERIAVVGLGAVGGSLAMALRRAWPASLVIGIDTHEAVEAAIRLHAIDVGADDLMIAGDADIIVLAGGATEAARVLPHLAGVIPRDATVLVMAAPEDITLEAAAMPHRLAVVAGLPSVEVRSAGIRAADADLFLGRPWPLQRLSGPEDGLPKAAALARAAGADPGGVPRA